MIMFYVTVFCCMMIVANFEGIRTEVSCIPSVNASCSTTRVTSHHVRRASQERKYHFVRGEIPWINDSYHACQGLSGLHKEIMDFYGWIKGTSYERNMRCDLIHRVKATLSPFIQDLEMQIFGSYDSGLHLPDSDIDILVRGENLEELDKERLISQFYEDRLAQSVTNLNKTTIPIVIIKDRVTGLGVDMLFANTRHNDTVDGNHVIKKYLIKYPSLAPLVYVIKYLLRSHDLNTVYTGGIKSYAVALMVINFLQNQTNVDSVSVMNVNLGRLLVDFFKYYGKTFNSTACAIDVRSSKICTPKDDVLPHIHHRPGHGNDHLVIVCPVNISRNLAGGSFKVMQVQTLFSSLHDQLVSRMYQGGTSAYAVISHPRSCLSSLFMVPSYMVSFRKWASIRYRHSKFTNITNCLP